MRVNSHNIEFGYELLSAVPYAYELYLQGKLTVTESGKLSEPLYYFSPRHIINAEPRSWYNTMKARSSGLPYTGIHAPQLEPKHFPPYKKVYANNQFKWGKPTLCICNRANVEWETGVLNFFDKETLTWLFESLKGKYEIVYFPIMIPEAIQDNGTPVFMFDDIGLANKHGVKVFTEIMGDHWNESILRVFANCEHYITMNGGYSILASYFSGQNIIYSKPGEVQTKEIQMGSFWRWYPNINNVQTLHVPSYDELKRKIKTLYIEKKPTAHVILRTSNRPVGFRNAISSILRQTYDNINIVVVCDDKRSLDYTNGYRCRVIIPEKVEQSEKNKPPGAHYGTWFPANDYIKQVQEKLNPGYIFFLDDDDIFLESNAIENVISLMNLENLAIWKVKFPHGIIPNKSFGIEPTLYDVTGIGLCYHTSQIDKSDWTPWKCADYRTAKGFDDDKIIWIDKMLTGLQATPGRGLREDVTTIHKPMIKSTDKHGQVRVQFVKERDGHAVGSVTSIPWIIAANYIHRGIVIELDTDIKGEEKKAEDSAKVLVEVKDNVMGLTKKEEKKPYTTKERKTPNKTKVIKNENN